jgi:hypothetical protein
MIFGMRATTILLALLLLLPACGSGDGSDGPGPGKNGGKKQPADDRPVVGGSVYDEDGDPLPGVKIHLRLPYGAGVAGHRGLTGETAEDGSFAFDVEGELEAEDAPVELAFTKEGHVAVHHRFQSFRPGIGLTLQLTMKRAGRLRGAVRDGEGRPVAGAIVYAIQPGIAGVRRLVEVIHVETGADGTFLLPGLPAGKMDVGVKARGYLAGLRTDLTVVAGRETPVTELVLRPGKSISGRVVLEGGKGPVDRAWVFVYRNPDLKGFTVFGRLGIADGGGHARVDEEGKFEVSGLADGEWDVDVLTLGLAPVRPGASGVAAGTEGLELVFARATAVKIRVYDGETGKPFPRFHVVIQNLSGPKGADGRPVVTVEADVRSPIGEYSFPAREDEVYSVETAVEGYRIDQRTVGPLEGGAPKLVKIVLKRRE